MKKALFVFVFFWCLFPLWAQKQLVVESSKGLAFYEQKRFINCQAKDLSMIDYLRVFSGDTICGTFVLHSPRSYAYSLAESGDYLLGFPFPASKDYRFKRQVFFAQDTIKNQLYDKQEIIYYPTYNWVIYSFLYLFCYFLAFVPFLYRYQKIRKYNYYSEEADISAGMSLGRAAFFSGVLLFCLFCLAGVCFSQPNNFLWWGLSAASVVVVAVITSLRVCLVKKRFLMVFDYAIDLAKTKALSKRESLLRFIDPPVRTGQPLWLEAEVRLVRIAKYKKEEKWFNNRYRFAADDEFILFFLDQSEAKGRRLNESIVAPKNTKGRCLSISACSGKLTLAISNCSDQGEVGKIVPDNWGYVMLVRK